RSFARWAGSSAAGPDRAGDRAATPGPCVVDCAHLVERFGAIEVPPRLLRDVLLGDDTLPPSWVLRARASSLGVGREPGIVFAARLRLRALMMALQDLFLPTVQDDSDIVLLHDKVFEAAAGEPLIALPDGDIGFDRESLRSRLLQPTAQADF